MGFPGEPPRRQPYDRPATPPPGQDQHWFEPAPHDRAAEPPPHGRPHPQEPWSQAPYPQASHPQEPYPQEPYPRSPYSQEPRARAPRPQPPYEQGPRSQVPYEQEPRTQGVHPEEPHPRQPYAPDPRLRERSGQEPSGGSGKKVPRPEEPKPAMWSPYDEGPRSRRPIYIAVGALAVLIAGGVGLSVLADSDPPPKAAASPAPRNPAVVPPSTAGGKFGFASSRTTDPYPLTLDELFKRRKVTFGGQSYLMTTRRTDKKCGNAVVGAKLQKALTAARCTQFLRASFRDASGKVIGTVGVANLKTGAGAVKVAKASTGKEREEYIKPLPGKDKVTKFLGTGEAFVGQWGYGHYTVMVWFQYKDGHAPKKTEVKKLNQAAFGVVDATVTPALQSRALTGKRP
ncbi:hypothetical protein FHS43_000710 [Streptosporangium becharense]|uniref:Uncharacterized protein n=1 Tax=Streptosporangium becharense TaxID=1816182 RepID=A0A7W9IGC7_9ACTN|nr:hypothetical protein [Streptosporangium becharense]MBB2909464.1 hypothetical protein [Streptosporangium becharense]MBB5819579.1 hypothetical protein [Streptosporangium becharense]